MEQVRKLYLSQVARKVHGEIFDADNFVKRGDGVAGDLFFASMFASLRPRHALEEMLVIQMTLTHQRVVRLSLKAV